MGNLIKVCVADDHALLRSLMSDLLGSTECIHHEILQAANGREVLNILAESEVDVLLLDLSMPEMDGIETAGKVLQEYPECKIIILTMTKSPAIVNRLMGMGVHGYLLKSCRPDEVQKAIIAVHERDFYHNDVSMEALKFARQLSPQQLPAELTSRELDVLKGICEERSTKQIGDLLFLSPKTVEIHRSTLMKKTGARNTAGLVKYAYEHGFISIQDN